MVEVYEVIFFFCRQPDMRLAVVAQLWFLYIIYCCQSRNTNLFHLLNEVEFRIDLSGVVCRFALGNAILSLQ